MCAGLNYIKNQYEHDEDLIQKLSDWNFIRNDWFNALGHQIFLSLIFFFFFSYYVMLVQIGCRSIKNAKLTINSTTIKRKEFLFNLRYNFGGRERNKQQENKKMYTIGKLMWWCVERQKNKKKTK